MASNPDPAAARRLNVLAQQLSAGADPTLQQHIIERQPTSGATASTSYASIDGRPSSYARVHGEVSRAPAAWRKIPVVAKEQLQEVLYDKAEGIAKVG
jgi:naphthoate synthase